MKAWRLNSGVLVLASMLVQSGCLFKKEPRKATIVIPPAPAPTAPAPMPPPPQLPPSSPQPTEKARTQMPQLPAPQAEKPKPAKPRPARRPVPTTATPTEATPAPPTQPATPPPASTPSLQPILATQEAADRTRRIAQYLEKARASIYRAEQNRPTPQLRDLITQVRTFVQQAEEARKSDLVRAENLAERAEVLSRALSK